ncbi:MAG: hypothetical protein M3396_07055 [Actinomycetota bacterium]|nr:hypothetical protein [Actinomycetota bacterium]MDQ3575181.1 hypothetical protein [Actinomycetota bacterium]
MNSGGPGGKDLGEEDLERIRRAHHGLRRASQELEALVAPKSVRGRWEPVAAPQEVLDTVRAEFQAAYHEVLATQQELLGWDGPEGVADDSAPSGPRRD